MGWRGPPPPFYPSAEHTLEDRNAVSAVLEGKLYITNFRGAESLDELRKIGCTHIAAVGSEFLDNKENAAANQLGIKFWNHDITDDEEEQASMAATLKSAAGFIAKALKRRKSCVLVHCAAGISRSATVVLGYLVLHQKHSLRDAFARLYASRSIIWPNDGFMRALIELEAKLRGKPTISMNEYESWGEYDGPEEELAAELSSLSAAEPSMSRHRGLNKQERKAQAKLATEEAQRPRRPDSRAVEGAAAQDPSISMASHPRAQPGDREHPESSGRLRHEAQQKPTGSGGRQPHPQLAAGLTQIHPHTHR